tara:strand:+ start:492 stop:1862 length:1371 start_codon:yes stop_codon:yes gene_type:complete
MIDKLKYKQNFSKKKNIYLYIKNHAKTGIEEYIEMIPDVFKKSGYNVLLTKKIHPNNVNIIIEEFSKISTIRKIKDCKKKFPKTKIILILTEFFTKKYGTKSLNFFENFFRSSILIAFTIFFKLIHKNDYRKIEKNEILIFLLFFPLNFIKFIIEIFFLPIIFIFYFLIHIYKMFLSIPIKIKQIINFYKKLSFKKMNFFLKKLFKGKIDVIFIVQRYARILFGINILNNLYRNLITINYKDIYFLHRFLGLQEVLPLADGLITSHTKIIPKKNKNIFLQNNQKKILGTIYPYLDTKLILKNIDIKTDPRFEITGSITNYRKKIVSKINKDIKKMKLDNQFLYCFTKDFQEKRINNNTFSLHIPQSKNWNFSSPTRIYRALTVDKTLPVIFRSFKQDPTEKLCFQYQNKESLVKLLKLHHNKSLLFIFLKKRLNLYNKFVDKNNKKLIIKFKKIIK